MRTFKPTDLNKTEGRFGGLSTSFLSQIMALALPLENGSLNNDFGDGMPSEMTPRTPAETAQGSTPVQSTTGPDLSDDRSDALLASSSGESVGLESISDRSEAEELDHRFLPGPPPESLDAYSPYAASTPGFPDAESPFEAEEETLPPEKAFDIVKDLELHLSLEKKSSYLSQISPAVRPSSSTAYGSPPQRLHSDSLASSSTKGTTPWHWMFRQRLSLPQAMKLHRGPVNALTLSAENSSESLTMYSVGKDGFIKVNIKVGLRSF